jgi:hypothetical protein
MNNITVVQNFTYIGSHNSSHQAMYSRLQTNIPSPGANKETRKTLKIVQLLLLPKDIKQYLSQPSFSVI